MNVLFIAPLPPPTTGHSLASAVLAEDLARTDVVDIVDLSLNSSHDGSVSAGRIREVGKVLWSVVRRVRRADVVYLTIAESVAGNLKDLLIYAACAGRLRQTVIHLHGGTIGVGLFDRFPTLRRANAVALRRLGAVIICGQSHAGIFEGMVAPERLHVIPNFALDEFFIDDAEMEAKHARHEPLRVLYLSGMMREKGYADLVEGYLGLDDATRAAIRIDFAGRFDDAGEQAMFEERVAAHPGLAYHGFVSGARKRELLAQAHVLCLPSRLHEGQPIAILEGYAAGCVVLATGQPGILDVFRDGENGFELEAGSTASIAAALRAVVEDRERAYRLALHNLREARAYYRRDRFSAEVSEVLWRRAAARAPLPSR